MFLPMRSPSHPQADDTSAARPSLLGRHALRLVSEALCFLAYDHEPERGYSELRPDGTRRFVFECIRCGHRDYPTMIVPSRWAALGLDEAGEWL